MPRLTLIGARLALAMDLWWLDGKANIPYDPFGPARNRNAAMKVTLKITSKGQVTLRREVLDELNVRPGDKVVVEPIAPGRVEMRRAEPLGSLRTFVGCLKSTTGPTLSLEDIEKVSCRGWAGEL
jgi:antitoxin PrlF